MLKITTYNSNTESVATFNCTSLIVAGLVVREWNRLADENRYQIIDTAEADECDKYYYENTNGGYSLRACPESD